MFKKHIFVIPFVFNEIEEKGQFSFLYAGTQTKWDAKFLHPCNFGECLITYT